MPRAVNRSPTQRPFPPARWTLLLALVASLAWLVACGESSDEPASDGGLRLLVTNAGACDWVLELAEPDELVGLPAVSRSYSPAVRARGGLPQLDELPSFSVESTLALAPDLIVTHRWQSDPLVDKLESLGIPFVALEDPERPEDFVAQFEALGAALGRPERARERAAHWRERIETLRARAPEVRPTAALYSSYAGGGTLPAKGTTYDLVLELAGLENAATKAGLVGHAPADHERLLALDPEYLVVSSALDDPLASPSRDHLLEEPVLANLRAVKARNIVVVPAAPLHSTSHFLVEAAELVASGVDELKQR